MPSLKTLSRCCLFSSFSINMFVFPWGLCQPRVPGTVGAEPFSAKLRYTGPEDPEYTNLIKLTVTMPHVDGRWLGWAKPREWFGLLRTWFMSLSGRNHQTDNTCSLCDLTVESFCFFQVFLLSLDPVFLSVTIYAFFKMK